MTGLREAAAIPVRWVALEAPGLDPLDALDASSEHDRFYWERPATGEAFVGLGRAAALVATGSGRFAEIERARRAQAARLAPCGELADAGARTHPMAYWLGGFGFDDEPAAGSAWHGFPAARFVLPRLLLVWRGERAFAVFAGGEAEDAAACRERLAALRDAIRARHASLRAEGAAGGFEARSEAAPADYRRRVADAVAAIRRGEAGLRKVVVARACRVRSRRAIEPARLLRQLRTAHPACASFAVARGAACFLGASPERLLRVAGGEVRSEALAGTRPRGRSPEEDAALARELWESAKDREEHALVVRAVSEALRPVCDALQVAAEPGIFATAGLQHLRTPMRGRLREPAPGLAELAGRLHPTPAVGGVPGPAARAWLSAHEALDRGWYAAPLGFLGADGGGELDVALRCALLRGRRALAWAGAGVVAHSDPSAELEETRLKLRTLLTPMMEI